jgi:hypothetical protein
MTFTEFRRNAKESAINNPSVPYGEALMDYLCGVSIPLYNKIPNYANPSQDDLKSDAFFDFVKDNWETVTPSAPAAVV